MRYLSAVTPVFFFLLFSCQGTGPQKAETFSLSSLLVRPGELPPGYTISNAGECQNHLARQAFAGKTLRYLQHARQAFIDEGRKPWIVDYYSTSFTLNQRDQRRLLGSDRESERNLLNPEEVMLYQNFVIVLCNGYKSAIRDWFTGRMTERLKEKAQIRDLVFEQPLEKAVFLFYQKDYEASYQQLTRVVSRLEQKAPAYFLLAELSMIRLQYSDAERNYRLFLQAGYSGKKISQRLQWAALHGRGLALARQKRMADAISSFLLAEVQAEKLGTGFLRALTYYDLSCAYAEINRKTRSLQYLKRSLAIDNRYRSMALEDSSFRTLKNHEEFKSLLSQ